MALIACKECKQQISDQAKMCPHCGCPIKKQKSGLGIAGMILGIVACAYTFGYCVGEILALEPQTQILPLIVIISIVAEVLSFSAFKSKPKDKRAISGIIMGVLSVIISSMFAILF